MKLSQNMTLADINPRKSWQQLPDCQNCHIDFEKPEPNFKSFNKWTQNAAALFKNRKDEADFVPCIACHNSPHAIYPTKNLLNPNHDNIQPLQYQKTPYPIGTNFECRICHKVKMDIPIHHPNMDRPFRNVAVVEKIGLIPQSNAVQKK